LLDRLKRELEELLREARECESIMLESLRNLCLHLSEEDTDEAVEFFLGASQAGNLEGASIAKARQEISRASARRLLAFLRRYLSNVM